MLIPDLERDHRNVLTGLGLGLDVIGDVSDGSGSVVFFDGATVFEEVERGISVDLVTAEAINDSLSHTQFKEKLSITKII